MLSRGTLGLAVALCMATDALAAPRPAHACGGFFCSRTPIDQSGENVVFAVEPDGTVTAHVQILYRGAAEQFAWILPVPSVPTMSVGTDALFQALAPVTAPQFALAYTTTGNCRSEPNCFFPGAPTGVPTIPSPGAPEEDSVSVYFRGGVGPYDAAILGAADADALRAWLTGNGYDIAAGAAALLDHYVALGDSFVALRLRQDRDVGEIQPIVLEYRERDPCIPIRLTAIATVPDMPITVYVLGASRAVPANYLPITPDLEVPDLYLGGPRTYADVVSQAVDEAGGHAFVTEVAGPRPDIRITVMPIDDLRAASDPRAFLGALLTRGFMGDSQVLALFERFLPPPPDVEPRTFYDCLARDCHDYDAYLATIAFDPGALVDALEEAIVRPRAEAQAMVERHAKLTRLFTTMSADEMTEDPVFTLAPGAPDVSRLHMAELVTECSPEYFPPRAPQRMRFASGREVRVREGEIFTGTAREYCAMQGGSLYIAPAGEPGGGGGLCAARARRANAIDGGACVVAVAVLAWMTRRRRNRSRNDAAREQARRTRSE